MENSFKVGDKVKILPRDDSTKYLPFYVNDMQTYAGRLATVTEVFSESCYIDLDKGCWYWPFKALQLVTSEADGSVDPYMLKNGDYIKLTSASCKGEYLIYIFREIKDNTIYRHASYSLSDKNINVEPNRRWFISKTTEITYATEEEKKLLDIALLEQGYVWNNLTKQLGSIGLVNISLANTYPNGIGVQAVDTSSFRNSIQKANDITNLLSCTKEEPQTETELNLFPTKKHYQLNFNY